MLFVTLQSYHCMHILVNQFGRRVRHPSCEGYFEIIVKNTSIHVEFMHLAPFLEFLSDGWFIIVTKINQDWRYKIGPKLVFFYFLQFSPTFLNFSSYLKFLAHLYNSVVKLSLKFQLKILKNVGEKRKKGPKIDSF